MGAQRTKRIARRCHVERTLRRRCRLEWVSKEIEEYVERRRCGRKWRDAVVVSSCNHAAITTPRYRYHLIKCIPHVRLCRVAKVVLL